MNKDRNNEIASNKNKNYKSGNSPPRVSQWNNTSEFTADMQMKQTDGGGGDGDGVHSEVCAGCLSVTHNERPMGYSS